MPFATLRGPKSPSAFRRRRNTILIVADDAEQSEDLAGRLELHGYQTIEAATGREGLESACEQLPDLIVLNVRLPDTDGPSVCAKLAERETTRGIPVILLSGMGRPDIIRRARSRGGHYFVRKPYDLHALLVLMESAISESSGIQPGRGACRVPQAT